MKLSIKYILLPLSFIITGCATLEITKQDTDDNSYYLETTINLGGTVPLVEHNALVSAKNHCERLGKEVLVYDIYSEQVSRSKWISKLKFYCLSSIDPRLDEDVYKYEGVYFTIE